MGNMKKTFGTVVCVLVLLAAIFVLAFLPKGDKETVYHDASAMLRDFENAITELNTEAELSGKFKPACFSYRWTNGSTVDYYCCYTSYRRDPVTEYTGLDDRSFEMMLDYERIENRRACEVNGLEAFQCEIGTRSYLCWTVSPTLSCVIEYTAGTVTEETVFQMAEIVWEPQIKSA